ncbi:MAG: 5-bromo-4-chloroindolyl phosphate hydrolysis family protein [Primorskyibacter sp.]
MSRRYTGTYSPDAPVRPNVSGPSVSGPDIGGTDDMASGPSHSARGVYDGAQPVEAGARSNVFFVPPIVLAATSLNDGAMGLATGMAAAGTLVLAAWLLRDGLRATQAYQARRVAKRPAIPRKLFAAGLTGIGVGLAALRNDPNILAAVTYGAVAVVLHVLAFGIDPLRDKQVEGVDDFQQNRVARVLDDAEALLGDMIEAAERSGDRAVASRVEALAGQVYGLMRTVEADPRDLTAARKYLGVYLRGARDATVKFADLFARTRDASARESFMVLLSDLETRFDQKTRALLLDDGQDLSIEIDVLRKRMQREGVRLETSDDGVRPGGPV